MQNIVLEGGVTGKELMLLAEKNRVRDPQPWEWWKAVTQRVLMETQ